MNKKELKKMTDRQLEKLSKELDNKAWKVRVEILRRDKQRFPNAKVH